MGHRIRFGLALHHGSFDKLTWEVEADETFIGGKARNMHNAERKRRITGCGAVDKTAVLGFLKRAAGRSEVRAFVIEDRKKPTLQKLVKKHVTAGSDQFAFVSSVFWFWIFRTAFASPRASSAAVSGSILTANLAGPGRSSRRIQFPRIPILKRMA